MKTVIAENQTIPGRQVFRIELPCDFKQVGENMIELSVPTWDAYPALNAENLQKLTNGLSVREFDELMARLTHMVNIEILRANIRIL